MHRLDTLCEMIEAPLGRPLTGDERTAVEATMTQADEGSMLAKVALSSLLGNAADWPEGMRLAAIDTCNLGSVYAA